MALLKGKRVLLAERMKHKQFWAEYFAELLSDEMHTHANLILHDTDCSFFITKKDKCDCTLVVLVETITNDAKVV